MGWMYHTIPSSKRDFIRERCQTEENETTKWETITKTVKGNCLWIVRKVTQKDAVGTPILYIELNLIERHDGCWGYKDMDESMHPYFYSCPLAYLEMVPQENAKWREGVRAYHAERSRKLEKGKCYKLKNTKPMYTYVEVESVRPLRGYVNGNWLAKVPRACIGEEIPDPFTVTATIQA